MTENYLHLLRLHLRVMTYAVFHPPIIHNIHFFLLSLNLPLLSLTRVRYLIISPIFLLCFDRGLNYTWMSNCIFYLRFFWTHSSVHRNSLLIKNPTRCNSMQIFIYCKVTLHVSGVTAPIIRSTKNCNRSLRYSYFPPTWPIRPRWREVAVPVLWLVPEVAVTVFSTPDDGCCDTRNM